MDKGFAPLFQTLNFFCYDAHIQVKFLEFKQNQLCY